MKEGARGGTIGSPTPYVELHCHSAFSFLDGASHPEELAVRAAELGYPALALTDHDGVYGSLEFAHAAKHAGVRPITGAEVTLTGGFHVTLLCENGKGYANLCRILTAAHAGTRRPGREDREPLAPCVPLETVAELSEGLVCLSGCSRDGLALHDQRGTARLAAAFGRERFFVELQRPFERGDAHRHATLRDLAAGLGVETIATGNVHAHTQRRALLQDALVAIRCRTSLDGCERERRGNREAVLRSPEEMIERFAGIDRAAAERTALLAERPGLFLDDTRPAAIARRILDLYESGPTDPGELRRLVAGRHDLESWVEKILAQLAALTEERCASSW